MKLLYTPYVIFLIAVICVVAVNFVMIRYSGSPVAVPDIPRSAENYGSGERLTFVVLGDSTAVSQGGDYDRGYARSGARFMAEQGYAVALHNFAVSGARAADVNAVQIPKAVKLQPDIVLIAAGANDVTHLSSVSKVRHQLADGIEKLQTANPKVHILLTGSPEMGSVPRFPWPAHSLARLQTKRINSAVQQLTNGKSVIFVPIAEKTGPTFTAHPELFAADKFHPNSDGYDLWTTVINNSIRTALTSR